MTTSAGGTNLSLSPSTIAGIVIGVLAGVALLAGAYLYLRRLRGSRGVFTSLRNGRPEVDTDEEFVSGGPSIHIHDRGYGHRQQPSLSLEPLLVPSPPQTYASQDLPAVSSSSLLRDGLYLPSPFDPILPPTDLSLYDTDDPFARLQNATLPISAPHYAPISSHRSLQEFGQSSRNAAKYPGSSASLFINRTLTRPSGPELPSVQIGASLFSPAELLQYSPSGARNDSTQLFDTDDVSQTKSRGLVSKTIVAERATLTGSKEAPRRVGAGSLDAETRKNYSRVSAPYISHPPDRQTLSKSPELSRRLTRLTKLPGLSTVDEGSTSINLPPSHDISTNKEIVKKPSISLSELEKSSSLSVALSHTGLECTSFPLLSSNNTFGKTDSSSSSHRWTSCSSSGQMTRYPSLALSSSGPSSSNSKRHSDSAVEWHRAPAGLAALTNIQLEPAKPSPSPSPFPRSQNIDIPNIPPSLLPAHRLSRSPSAADKKREVKPRTAHLRTHSPGSVPEVERRSIVQGGIASIDVAL